VKDSVFNAFKICFKRVSNIFQQVKKLMKLSKGPFFAILEFPFNKTSFVSFTLEQATISF